MGLGRTWTALLATQVAVVGSRPARTATQMIWGLLKPTMSGPGMDVDRFLTGWLVMEGDDFALWRTAVRTGSSA